MFLLLAVILFYVLPKKGRILLCFLASLLFYTMWRWEFAFLMLFSTVVDFFASKRIAQANDQNVKRNWLLVSLVLNLGLLVFFKYTYFIQENIQGIASILGGNMPGVNDFGMYIILPLGISFYTFQTISYTIDVYRGITQPTNNFALFGAYVTFWPQLIAGPILRAEEVMPQFNRKPRLEFDNISFGIMKILLGLFKKVVLADNISPFVEEAFSMPSAFLTGFDIWVATILFGFQIYFDFSGYSDIAIGSARILGFKFPENFNWPYLAKSPREFWKRWHISLSSWIRDYLYLPLMGQKFRTDSKGGLEIKIDTIKSTKRKNINPNFALFATWIIMGFWHGAGWNFALWGLFHATYIYLFRKVTLLKRFSEKMPIGSAILTFFIIMASWIPFRSVDFVQTLTLYSGMLNPFNYSLGNHQLHFKAYLFATLLIIFMLVSFALKHLFEKNQGNLILYFVPRYAGIAVLTFFVIVYLQTKVQFIYFQF